MRFRPEQHLRRQSEIRAVREKGRRIDCRAFTLWWKRRDAPAVSSRVAHEPPPEPATPPDSPTPRVCVIASTAAVGNAVRRNRAKRRLRELFRSQQQHVPSDCDLLLVARASATTFDLADLQRRFAEACVLIAKS